MVDFSNFSNTDFNTTPFQYVVFGKGGSLLEVELNEAQYLGFLRDRESLRNLGNRCINGEVKSNGTDITITGDLIINGYYIHSLNSTIKSVGLPKFLYAKVSIIDYNGNSVVKNNGYIDGNIIPNTIIDSRMGFETTRRRGIQLEFSTIDSDGAIKLLEDDGHGGIRFSIPTMTLSDSVDKAVSELKTNIQSIETNKVTSWSKTPSNTKYPSEKLVKDSLDGKANSNHTHTKSQITDFPTSLPASDVSAWAKESNKPTYTASEVGALASTTTHLSGDIATSEKGSANGVAELDENGIIISSQLPSYVDDVIEGYFYNSKFYKESTHTTEITGEAGKIPHGGGQHYPTECLHPAKIRKTISLHRHRCGNQNPNGTVPGRRKY